MMIMIGRFKLRRMGKFGTLSFVCHVSTSSAPQSPAIVGRDQKVPPSMRHSTISARHVFFGCVGRPTQVYNSEQESVDGRLQKFGLSRKIETEVVEDGHGQSAAACRKGPHCGLCEVLEASRNLSQSGSILHAFKFCGHRVALEGHGRGTHLRCGSFCSDCKFQAMEQGMEEARCVVLGHHKYQPLR